MPTLLTQWGIDPTTNAATSIPLTPNATLPAGTFVVVGLCGIATTPTYGISDTGGNTWTTSSVDAGADVFLATSVLSNPLTTASTITITSTANFSRHAVACAAFTDAVTGPGTLGTFNETTSTTVTGGTVTPAVDSIIVGVTGFVSSGRVFTAGAGWTASTKHLSTFGSGERAVQLVWRDGTASTAYSTIGTLSTGGVMDTCLGYVTLGAPVPGAGWDVKPVKVWMGTGLGWVVKPTKVWAGVGPGWVTKPTRVWMGP